VTRRLLAAAALAAFAAGCTLAPGWRAGDTGSATAGGVAPLRALVAFARTPSEATWSAVPLADEVYLGLGSELVEQRTDDELRDPEAWKLDRELFRAAGGPFSALELLARERPLAFAVGPHSHCASPPMPPPRQVAGLTRMSAQPRRVGSCLQWFTVDAFVTRDGEIAAVTLDLWEP
jgi:hypothetical protein